MKFLRPLVSFILVSICATGCAFSRQIEIRTHPPGAQAWLEREPIGITPTTARAKTTGTIPKHTFDPQLVTFELDGYERTVRHLDYKWSLRNVLASVPLVLGVPGIFLWGKEPVDMWVVLTPEAKAGTETRKSDSPMP